MNPYDKTLLALASRRPALLVGPCGCGKTMLARAIAQAMLPMGYQYAKQANTVYHIAGIHTQWNGEDWTDPKYVDQLEVKVPFRAPHHTSSQAGIYGSYGPQRGRMHPGEVSLAHGGILFLDEAPEFQTSVLQCIADTYETKRATVWSGIAQSEGLPADFHLILASNPCPCGKSQCICTARQKEHYLERVLDVFPDAVRIDMKPGWPQGKLPFDTLKEE